ncbi:4470_t:CDS:1, partial [Cetraspora pellucida]
FPDMINAEARFNSRLAQQNLNQNNDVLLDPIDNDLGEDDEEALMVNNEGIDNEEVDSDEISDEEIDSEGSYSE